MSAPDYVGKLHVHLSRGREIHAKENQLEPAAALIDLHLADASLPPKGSEEASSADAALQQGQFQSRPLAKPDMNPIWNQAFTFAVARPFMVLEVIVRNRPQGATSGTTLGRIRIPLVDICDQRQVTRWFPIRQRPQRSTAVVGGDSGGAGDDGPGLGELSLTLHYKYLATWNTLYKGVLLYQQKQFAQSVRMLTDCEAKFSTEPMLYAYRSESAARSGQQRGAQADALKVTELVPNSGEGYYRQGLVSFFREAYQEAEQYYKQALKYDSWHLGASEALANLRRESIQQQVRKAVAKGRHAFELDEFELAEDHFNDAISSNPRNARYFVFRALTRLASRDYTGANEDAMHVIALQPQWPKTDPEKQGYLAKEGQINIMWQKRWFILKNHFIYYYNTRQDMQPNGVIMLGPEFEVQLSKARYLRIVTPGRTFVLKAENKEQRDAWITVLEQYMNRPKILLPSQGEEEEEIFVDVSAEDGDDNSAKRASAAENVKHPSYVPGAALSKVGGKLSQLVAKPISLDNIAIDGSLWKLGELNKIWKKRFFVLKQQTLYYFSIPEEVVRQTTPTELVPTGSVDLNNVKIIDKAAHSEKEFSFEIVTSQRRYILSASSRADLDAWVSALRVTTGDVVTPPPVLENGGHEVSVGDMGGDVVAETPATPPQPFNPVLSSTPSAATSPPLIGGMFQELPGPGSINDEEEIDDLSARPRSTSRSHRSSRRFDYGTESEDDGGSGRYSSRYGLGAHSLLSDGYSTAEDTVYAPPSSDEEYVGLVSGSGRKQSRRRRQESEEGKKCCACCSIV